VDVARAHVYAVAGLEAVPPRFLAEKRHLVVEELAAVTRRRAA
jgi:hypothetical protein